MDDNTTTDSTVDGDGTAADAPQGLRGAVAAGTSGGQVEITLRLYRTTDDRLVVEDHPDAAFLFATPGMRIPVTDAERYGLLPTPAPETTTDTDTRTDTTADAETATDTEVTAAPDGQSTSPPATVVTAGPGKARRKPARPGGR